MAHGRQRKEKNCLNCNARVFGPYCHVCGQHNTEPRESAWDLLVHFVNDITHFEGKFITSLRYLLFKPGFLTSEYIRGRRASYMNPVRMYVFTSAFFFILFFLFFNPKDLVTVKDTNADFFKNNALQLRDSALYRAKNQEDSLAIDSVFRLFNIQPSIRTYDSIGLVKEDSSLNLSLNFGNVSKYNSISEYDSVQQHLPDSLKDGWYTRFLTRKTLDLRTKYGYDQKRLWGDFLDHYFHSFPKILFLSLPLFAFLLYLLYIRKKMLYTEHLLFTIHYFIFAFIWLLFLFVGIKLADIFHWSGGNFLWQVWWVVFFYYLYRAMRNYYQQNRTKTLLKYFLLLFTALFLNLLLFSVFFFFSLFNV